MLVAKRSGTPGILPVTDWIVTGGQWLRRHLLLIGAVPLGLMLIVWLAVYYFTIARFIVSTDDSYVQADSTIVASRASGYVSAVLVQDDQSVHAGEVLARIDDREFRAALDQALADARAAQAEVDDLRAQLAQQDSLIARARASVAASESAGAVSEDSADRIRLAAAIAGSRCRRARAQCRS
jgi:membrane fusion protein, multidrug efflux system